MHRAKAKEILDEYGFDFRDAVGDIMPAVTTPNSGISQLLKAWRRKSNKQTPGGKGFDEARS